jgi:amino acid transporter
MSKGKGKTVFAREATGLVREIGWFTALALVMSAVIGSGINGFAVTAYGYTATNSVSPLAMVLLAGIPFLCSAVCLGIMSSAMPRSGGPYVIISRSVRPVVGYLVSWGSWVSIALSVGLLAWYDMVFWGSSFTIAGIVSSNSGLTALGGWISSTWPSILLGLILTIIISLLVVFGVNIWGRVVQALFIIPAIGSILTLGVLLMHTAADFPSFWNAAFGTTSFTAANMTTPQLMSWLNITSNSAAVPYSPTFIGSLAALPGIVFAYTAFYASSYVGGEVKNPKRNMITSSVIGMLLIIVLYILYTGGLARAVGENFLYIYNVAYSGFAPATLPFFAAVYAFGIPALAIFIAITGAIWLLNDLPPFFLVATRSTFAWSFDRQFPERFADVNERFHSPVWSTLLCLIIAIPAVFLSALTTFSSLYFVTMIDTFTYLFICVAGLLFIRKYKSAYDKGAKLGGRGTLYLAGIIGVIFWIFMIAAMWYFILFAPSIIVFSGYVYAPFWEVTFTILTFVLGALVYFYYKRRNARAGIDVRKIYSEIPPE